MYFRKLLKTDFYSQLPGLNLSRSAGINKWTEMSAGEKKEIVSKCQFIVQLLEDTIEKEDEQIYKAGLFLLFVFTGTNYTRIGAKNIKNIVEELYRTLQDNMLALCISRCFNSCKQMQPSVTDIELRLFLYKNSLQ